MIVRRLNEILADPNMQERDLTVELSRTRRPGGGHGGGRRPGTRNRLSLQSLDARMNQMDARITRIERTIEQMQNEPPLWFRQWTQRFQTNLDNRLNQMENRINTRIDQVEDNLNERINQVEANLNARLDRIVQLNNLKQ